MALNFTERYLKMCKKAHEIQKDYMFHYGDYCIITKYKYEQIAILQMYEKTKYRCILMFDNGCSVMVVPDYLILIPSQDQLQRMVIDESDYPSDDLYKLKAKFESWLEYEPPHTSYNELWLAFVMKEKYNKVWSDKKENWENISVS